MTNLFETVRLGCRHWVPEDIDDLYAVYADEEGARFVDDGQPITWQECEEWMEVTLNNYRTRGYGMFAVTNRSDGCIVGFCGLVHPGGQDEMEVKYSFYKEHWGKGFASEVVPALLAYAASSLSASRVIATVASGNKPSQRVLEKSGMRFVEVEPDGDTLLYEWQPAS